jgi:hypothetical protein
MLRRARTRLPLPCFGLVNARCSPLIAWLARHCQALGRACAGLGGGFALRDRRAVLAFPCESRN